MSEAPKKNTFFGGAAILAVSAILVKLIGAVYKLPLANILTNAAYSDFTGAYNIYNLFLTISTAGLPVALSKTISEADALGKHNEAKKVFKVAFTVFLVMGLISFFCMTVLAVPVSNLVINNSKAVWCVLALAPSVLCVCVMSAFRGYFQGRFNMTPTAISQVIEALFKLVVGLGLAIFILQMAIQPPDLGERLPAVGAIAGISIGSIVALIYLLLTYRKARRSAPASLETASSSRRIFLDLMKIAIPITIGSASTALVNLIDSSLVMSQLKGVFGQIDAGTLAVAGDGILAKAGAIFDSLKTAAGAGVEPVLDAARSLKGVYDKALAIYSLPSFMMVPLTACIVPAVSACLAKRDAEGARHISESALRVGLLLALPMGLGLLALGGPIMSLVVVDIDASIAGPLLSILGLASICVSIELLCNAILQANGHVNLPIAAVVAGGVVKIVLTLLLVGRPNVLIYGAPIGTLACFLVINLLDLFFIHRSLAAPPSFLRAFVKPLLASGAMALTAWGTHKLLAGVLFGMSRFQRVLESGEVVLSYLGGAVATLCAILVGVAVYAALVLVLKAISREDLELMPKGDKIAKLLHIK